VAWMDDDMRRPAASAGEPRGGGTVHGLRGALVQAGRADGQAGRHASPRPKSSQNRADSKVYLLTHYACHLVAFKQPKNKTATGGHMSQLVLPLIFICSVGC